MRTVSTLEEHKGSTHNHVATREHAQLVAEQLLGGEVFHAKERWARVFGCAELSQEQVDKLQEYLTPAFTLLIQSGANQHFFPEQRLLKLQSESHYDQTRRAVDGLIQGAVYARSQRSSAFEAPPIFNYMDDVDRSRYSEMGFRRKQRMQLVERFASVDVFTTMIISSMWGTYSAPSHLVTALTKGETVRYIQKKIHRHAFSEGDTVYHHFIKDPVDRVVERAFRYDDSNVYDVAEMTMLMGYSSYCDVTLRGVLQERQYSNPRHILQAVQRFFSKYKGSIIEQMIPVIERVMSAHPQSSLVQEGLRSGEMQPAQVRPYILLEELLDMLPESLLEK